MKTLRLTEHSLLPSFLPGLANVSQSKTFSGGNNNDLTSYWETEKNNLLNNLIGLMWFSLINQHFVVEEERVKTIQACSMRCIDPFNPFQSGVKGGRTSEVAGSCIRQYSHNQSSVQMLNRAALHLSSDMERALSLERWAQDTTFE